MDIKIIYTEESGRPPLYTTMANLPEQEKFFSKIIKEVVKADGKIEVVNNPVANTRKEVYPVIITDNLLIKELLKRGKSEKSISKFLNISEEIIKNIL
jgi:hypothetical protein